MAAQFFNRSCLYRDLFSLRPSRIVFLSLTIIGLALSVSGCASLRGKPVEIQYDSEATRLLLDRTLKANPRLEAFKGVGRVVIEAGGDARSYDRTAWVGSEPGRLRFAFRSPAGMPVFTMSCDEQWVMALNHTDGQSYRRRIGDNSLSSFLPVEIKCADLYGLMAGRPPGVAYDSASAAPTGADAKDTIVIRLQRRFRGTVARLHIDRDTGDLRWAELIDIHGNPLYEVTLADVQIVGGYRLPGKIKLAGPDGRIALDIQRIWLETDVDRKLFHIVPPEAKP